MGLLTKKIKLLFDYYINSSLHVSFCIISYIITIKLINKFPFDWGNISFVFFTTFFTYNFIKFYEIVISTNRPISFVLKLFFSKALFAFLISFYLFFDLSQKVFVPHTDLHEKLHGKFKQWGVFFTYHLTF